MDRRRSDRLIHGDKRASNTFFSGCGAFQPHGWMPCSEVSGCTHPIYAAGGRSSCPSDAVARRVLEPFAQILKASTRAEKPIAK